MLDPMLIQDLIQDDVDWPSNLSSDISKISWFARENDISLEELLSGLDTAEQRLERIDKSERGREGMYIDIWFKATQKAIWAKRNLVGTETVLDTPLTGGDHEYAAKMLIPLTGSSKKHSIQIVQKRTDDAQGTMTGVPNAEYWDGTPGQYHATTILGWDKYSSRGGDTLCIDGGSNWCVNGMNTLRDEIEEKYGDEIKKEVNESRNIRAKKVYESMEDVLRPKTQEKIEIELESYIDDLAEMAVEIGEYEDFYEARELFTRNKDKIKKMIQQEFTQEGILGTLIFGWE